MAQQSARKRPAGVESTGTLVAVMAIGGIGISVLLLAPAMVGQLITEYTFSPQQAAYLISAEMVGIAVAALPALFWLNRCDWRIVLRLALCGSSLFLILSALCTDFIPLAATRFLGGLSSGTAVSVGLATCGLRRHTERVFGLCVMAQLVFGALGLALFPSIVGALGMQGMYLVLALATMLCLAAVPYVPSSSGPQATPDPDSTASPRCPPKPFRGILAIAGLYLFYVSLNGVWTFLERIGVGSALADSHVDHLLSLASLMGIVGAAAAAFLGTRWGTKGPPVFGITLALAAFVVLMGDVSAFAFLLAACMFKFAWTFALPYYLGGISSTDRQGRMIVIGNIFVGGGLASGPAIAAQLAGNPGYDRMLMWASLAMLASLVAVLPVLFSTRKPDSTPPAVADQSDSTTGDRRRELAEPCRKVSGIKQRSLS